MAKEVWINMPVKDPETSKAFYSGLGFTVNEQQGDPGGSFSIKVGDPQIMIMFFPESAFGGFTGHPTADAKQAAEVLFSIGAESKDEVDELARKAEQAGGTVFSRPAEHNGFMYGCGFADPDGHRWNALYMDYSKMPHRT